MAFDNKRDDAPFDFIFLLLFSMIMYGCGINGIILKKILTGKGPTAGSVFASGNSATAFGFIFVIISIVVLIKAYSSFKALHGGKLAGYHAGVLYYLIMLSFYIFYPVSFQYELGYTEKGLYGAAVLGISILAVLMPVRKL